VYTKKIFNFQVTSFHQHQYDGIESISNCCYKLHKYWSNKTSTIALSHQNHIIHLKFLNCSKLKEFKFSTLRRVLCAETILQFHAKKTHFYWMHK